MLHDEAVVRGSVAPSNFADAQLGRRDKLVLLTALAAVVGLAWAYLILIIAPMHMAQAEHAGMGMAVTWTATHFLLTLMMWIVMMVAMMFPSATPMVLTYATVASRIAPSQGQRMAVSLFATGYLLVWSAFSLGLTLLQLGFEQAALLSPEMVTSSPYLGGGLLIVAGLYQWSPAKDFCLKHCRAPLTFIAYKWRPGFNGALRMGIQHGAFCLGCCWALMLLLFVGGVMNLIWVALISIFVILEKLMGAGTRAGRWLSGVGLIAAGAFVLAA